MCRGWSLIIRGWSLSKRADRSPGNSGPNRSPARPAAEDYSTNVPVTPERPGPFQRSRISRMRSTQEASTARASAIRWRLSSAEADLSAARFSSFDTDRYRAASQRAVPSPNGSGASSSEKVLEVVGSARPALCPDQRVPPVSHLVAVTAVDGVEPRVIRSRADRVGRFGVPLRVTPQVEGEVHGVRDGALRPRRAGGEREEPHRQIVTELPPGSEREPRGRHRTVRAPGLRQREAIFVVAEQELMLHVQQGTDRTGVDGAAQALFQRRPAGGIGRRRQRARVPHPQAQVGQQLEEPVVAPQIGSARTELLVHVHEEGMSGQDKRLTRRPGDAVVVEGSLDDAHHGRVVGRLLQPVQALPPRALRRALHHPRRCMAQRPCGTISGPRARQDLIGARHAPACYLYKRLFMISSRASLSKHPAQEFVPWLNR